MSHSKSCRCKICCSSYPDCNSHDCSYHWKNRFCKLRKQWSEHSRCGSIKQSPEDCPHSRSPCDKTVGRFGVAWVAEVSGCDNGEPKGWQVEIIDTTPGILKKCKELIEWLNNPPTHLFDSIKGNEVSCNIRYPKCNLNTCDECWEEPCSMKISPHKCEEVRVPRRCKINCEEQEVGYDPHCRNCQTRPNCNQQKCPTRQSICQSKCCEQYHEGTRNRTNAENSDPENSKPRHSKCRWSASLQNEGDDVFRKESCCCHCHEKYFKDAGTTYEIDIVPQRDHPEHGLTSDDLDSRIVCAGIRTSQICKKVKEERKNQLIEKHERELKTVIASRSSDDETTNSLYMSSMPDNHSIVNSNLLSNSMGSHQRRSSKFRRKEST